MKTKLFFGDILIDVYKLMNCMYVQCLSLTISGMERMWISADFSNLRYLYGYLISIMYK